MVVFISVICHNYLLVHSIFMARNSRKALLFKLIPIYICFFLLFPIIALFLMEIYLNKVEKDSFYSYKSNVINEGVITNESESFDKDSIISNKGVMFNTDEEVSEEVWSRESYFIELLRMRDFHLSNFHESYISDFYGFKKDNLFLKNRGGAKEEVDSFKIKASTLPLDKNKESIFVIGDSVVAGQNSIDENQIRFDMAIAMIFPITD